MCSPLALAGASFGLGTASSVANYASQGAAASQQADFQNRRYTENAKVALESYRDTVNALQIRDTQEVDAATREATQFTSQVREASGKAKAGFASAGVSGNSVNALMDNFNLIEADSQYIIGKNLDMKRRQISESAKSARADAQSRISSATPQPVSTPSPFALLLDVAGSGLNSLSLYDRYSPNGIFGKSK